MGLRFSLRSLTLGDINHSTNEFNEIAGRTENGMSSAVNVPDAATRMHQAGVRFKLYLFTDLPLHQFFNLGLVIGMNPLEQFFESGQTIVWIETLNAVAFLRPVPDVGVGAPGPAACVAEFLRLCQIGLSFP